MSAPKIATLKVKNIGCIKNMEFKFELRPSLMCIVGGNGSGKTTLLNLLSAFLPNYKLDEYFYGDISEDAKVDYQLGEHITSFERERNKWKSDKDKTNLIKKGTYESGIVYGNRFIISSKDKIKEYNNYYRNFDNTSLIDASEFVVHSLGNILRNDKEYYAGLKTITKTKKIENARNQGKDGNYLIKKETPFLWRKETSFITQYEMSSGEFMLLRLLNFIDSRMKKSDDAEARLVLIDEVEIALHPAAQKRLFYFFKTIAREKNVCVIFSTHSQAIINMCQPNELYYMKTSLGGTIIETPCFPNFAVRNTYELNGYDFIIIVEDELARRIVLDTIDRENLYKNKLIHVFVGGGWTQIVPLINDFVNNKLFPSSRIIAILDKDIKSKFLQKYMSPCDSCLVLQDDACPASPSGFKKLPHSIPFHDDVMFLPVDSLEKEVFSKLITYQDYDFINSLDCGVYFKTKQLIDIIDEYKLLAKESHKFESYKKYDKDGKKLWEYLLKHINPHLSKESFITNVCNILMAAAKNSEDSWSEFTKLLKHQLNFTRR